MKTKSRLLIFILVTIFAVSLTAFMTACSSTPATTSPTETPGPAAMLAFTTQPVGAIIESAFTTQPEVSVVDAKGNIVTSCRGLVVLTITSGTGTSRAKLFGGTTVALENSVAIFKDLSIDRAGVGYTLTATSGNLTPAISEPFDITPGAAAKLAFSKEPVGAKYGEPFSVQPVVVVQDSGGATVTSYTGPITLAVTHGWTTLSGTTVVRAVNGVAEFNDLSIDRVGPDYTLTATGGGLVPAKSRSFEIVSGPAVKLSFNVQPESGIAGLPFFSETGVVVLVEDIDGNRVTGSTAAVSLTITPGTGADGATLSGTTVVKATNGVTIFEDLSIDMAGTDYTLTATSGNLTPAVSEPFVLF